MCGIQLDGDLLIYRVSDQSIHKIKGVVKIEKDDSPQLYINNSGSIILIKQSYFLWMWTVSKEKA
jgi:hypothetical protein